MKIDEHLIAPCGMNCALCIAYQFKVGDLNRYGFHRSYCPGCIPRGKNCTFTAGLCAKLAEGTVRFCYECPEFPCARLKRLDKRYKTKYGMSMIDNLNSIKEKGIETFLEQEATKWRCPECGALMSCHKMMCLTCNIDSIKKPVR